MTGNGKAQNIPLATRELLACFVHEYAEARRLFLNASDASGESRLAQESFACPAELPDIELGTDVCWFGEKSSERLLVISSGLHGVEGELGSALQSMLLKSGLVELACERGWSVLMLHALNPFGFAAHRRWDEENVDPNRNFLLPGEHPSGSHPTYQKLAGLLNPDGAPSSLESLNFYSQVLQSIARFGFNEMKQAIAEGQFDFPQGIFFGGQAPCFARRVLERHLAEWIAPYRDVWHLDIHSGLGRWGTCKLLLDYTVDASQRSALARYRSVEWEDVHPDGTAYNARGGMGKWCNHHFHSKDRRYLYLCAEFGTYAAIKMLRVLRTENRAWQHADQMPNWVVEQLREAFCPRHVGWQKAVANTFWQIVMETLEA